MTQMAAKALSFSHFAHEGAVHQQRKRNFEGSTCPGGVKQEFNNLPMFVLLRAVGTKIHFCDTPRASQRLSPHTLEPPAQCADIVLSLFSFFLSLVSPPPCVLSSSLPPSAPHPPHPPKPLSPHSPSLCLSLSLSLSDSGSVSVSLSLSLSLHCSVTSPLDVRVLPLHDPELSAYHWFSP